MDRRVAVFGGRHKEDDGDYDYFGGNQHSVWFYDVAGDAWEEAPALTDVGPAARDHHAAAYVDGGLYVTGGAGKGCELPNFKGSSLGRVPLVSADFWTSDHPSERSRCFLWNARATLHRPVSRPGGDARVLTAVYYVNDAGWDCGRDGGALRLWDVRGGAHRDVAPARDRLVVFLSRLVAHEVRAAKRDRYALSVWFKEPYALPPGA